GLISSRSYEDDENVLDKLRNRHRDKNGKDKGSRSVTSCSL
ncbi:unnamed protein product, partial [marine sediment metagenome]